jgi:hypothetical protein
MPHKSTSRQLNLFRARHEPAEPAALDPVNEALDRIEAEARTVLDAGGEAALRARLARIMPAALQAAPSSIAAGAGRGRRGRAATS